MTVSSNLGTNHANGVLVPEFLRLGKDGPSVADFAKWPAIFLCKGCSD